MRTDGGQSDFPLLPLQEGMLFNGLARTGDEVQQVVLRPPPGERVDGLRGAFERAVERHEALRTTIRYRDAERPHTEVHASSPTAWRVEACGDPLGESLLRILEHDREHPIDVEVLPITRFTEVRGGDGDALVWTFLHTHLDGRSIRCVLEEVLGDHAGLDRPREPSPSPALHVAAALDPARIAKARSHYQHALAGLAVATPTPGFGRSSADTPASPKRVRECFTRVTAEAMRALEAEGSRLGFSWASAVNAAWALVLGQYGHTDDVAFGVTRACRDLVPSSRSTVGCLINTVPMRVTLDPSEGVAAYLARVHGRARTPRELEPVALREAAAVSELRDPRQLVRTIVVCEDHTLEEAIQDVHPALAGWRVQLRGQSAAPLTLAAYRRRDGALDVVVEYDGALIEGSTARALGPSVAKLLAGFAAHPQGRVRDLDPGAPDAVLFGPAPHCAPETVSELLRDALVDHREAVAVEDAATGALLRYGELHARAEALLDGLHQRGARPGDMIAVMAARSVETVVALTACQLGELVFLPLDPAISQERLQLVLDDSGAQVIVTADGHVQPRSPSPRGTPPTAPRSVATPRPESPAYLLYTSGSTGAPKGVLVPQRALAAHARAATAMLALTADDRVLQFASPCFDVYLEEVIPTLVCGARLVVRDEASASSTTRLLDLVDRTSVTVLQLPTAYFHELAHDLARTGRAVPACVRVVVTGGERLSSEACRRFRAVAPSLRLVNAYGPTEVTITATAFDVPRRVPDIIPIGRPTGACQAQVLDRWGRTAPRGALGELALSGPQVALGYLGRPSETSRSFGYRSVHSLQHDLYRTGDLVRVDDADQLVFEGRLDGQVKVRGFRVELGEVEHALERDPAVARAAAAVVRAPSEEVVLVGFVVPGPSGFRERELLAAMATRVPGHLVPTRLFAVETLPTTPGGKLDRRALIWPADVTGPALGLQDADALAERLGDIFREVLRDPALHVDDSFFDRGGTSIRALRLVASIEERLGGRPTVATLITHPTPRELARWLRATGTVAPRAEVVPLNASTDRQTPVYCVVGLHAYTALAAGIQRRPVFGVYVDEEVEFPDDTLTVGTLAAAYLRAIEAHRAPPKVMVGISFGAFVALEMARQLTDRGAPPDLIVLLDPRLPSTLEAARVDPLLNFAARLRIAPETIPQRAKDRLLRAVSPAAPSAALAPDQALWAAREAAYARALEAYEPTLQAYPGLAHVYLARDDSPARLPKMQAQWRALVGAGSTVDVVPGAHGTLLQEPFVSRISAAIDATLRRRPSVAIPAAGTPPTSTRD